MTRSLCETKWLFLDFHPKWRDPTIPPGKRRRLSSIENLTPSSSQYSAISAAYAQQRNISTQKAELTQKILVKWNLQHWKLFKDNSKLLTYRRSKRTNQQLSLQATKISKCKDVSSNTATTTMNYTEWSIIINRDNKADYMLKVLSERLLERSNLKC